VRSLSFRTKLTLAIAAVTLAAEAAVTIPFVFTTKDHGVRELDEKASAYARLMGPQLQSALEDDDAVAARNVLKVFALDQIVAGLALYTVDGRRLDGLGHFPARIVDDNAAPSVSAGRALFISPVRSLNSRIGTLAITFSTRNVDAEMRAQLRTIALAAAFAFSTSMLIATLLARTIAGRVRRIGVAASKVAAGDYDRPPVRPGADDEIGRLVQSFNTMVEKVREQFAERKRLAASEHFRLESEVGARTAQLEESREQYRLIAESTNAIPFTYLPNTRTFVYIGPQVERCLGYPAKIWETPDFVRSVLAPQDADALCARLADSTSGEAFDVECTAVSATNVAHQLRWVITIGTLKGEPCLRGLILDVTQQRKLETGLQQAQKLESVGRLASGVAHEINTPVQFASDSIGFLRTASSDLLRVIDKMRIANESILSDSPSKVAAAEAAEAEAGADLSYLVEEIPRALDSAHEGLTRVATIVRSLKEFARPETHGMTEIDLNSAVESTLVVASNEYRYVADVETHFDDLPSVVCHASEISQAVLNIVINAAQAIGEVVKSSGAKGRIIVRTRRDGDLVIISISDTGAGIPKHLQARIFDPFFTTRDVGKGTGQGLTFARATIVDRHGGELIVESEGGRGAAFHIRLPMRPAHEAHKSAA
jgi:signal transduction histidine kinase/HAMP domain-containing protein